MAVPKSNKFQQDRLGGNTQILISNPKSPNAFQHGSEREIQDAAFASTECLRGEVNIYTCQDSEKVLNFFNYFPSFPEKTGNRSVPECGVDRVAGGECSGAQAAEQLDRIFKPDLRKQGRERYRGDRLLAPDEDFRISQRPASNPASDIVRLLSTEAGPTSQPFLPACPPQIVR